jgi:RNA polymerase sigma-70 factor (ECF subfamily)
MKIMSTETAHPPNDDTALRETVNAAQSGDREAFGRLVERFQKMVYGIAYRQLRHHSESQELCQDVFLQAMRKIGQLHDAACFGAWLRSIAGRMAINRVLRRRSVRAADANGIDGLCVENETPLSLMLARERNHRMHQGLRRLRALDRQTLTAFYFDGRSLVEMSEAFASPIGTIKRRLHVARKRLAKELQGMAIG